MDPELKAKIENLKNIYQSHIRFVETNNAQASTKRDMVQESKENKKLGEEIERIDDAIDLGNYNEELLTEFVERIEKRMSDAKIDSVISTIFSKSKTQDNVVSRYYGNWSEKELNSSFYNFIRDVFDESRSLHFNKFVSYTEDDMNFLDTIKNKPIEQLVEIYLEVKQLTQGKKKVKNSKDFLDKVNDILSRPRLSKPENIVKERKRKSDKYLQDPEGKNKESKKTSTFMQR